MHTLVFRKLKKKVRNKRKRVFLNMEKLVNNEESFWKHVDVSFIFECIWAQWIRATIYIRKKKETCFDLNNV